MTHQTCACLPAHASAVLIANVHGSCSGAYQGGQPAGVYTVVKMSDTAHQPLVLAAFKRGKWLARQCLVPMVLVCFRWSVFPIPSLATGRQPPRQPTQARDRMPVTAHLQQADDELPHQPACLSCGAECSGCIACCWSRRRRRTAALRPQLRMIVGRQACIKHPKGSQVPSNKFLHCGLSTHPLQRRRRVTAVMARQEKMMLGPLG